MNPNYHKQSLESQEKQSIKQRNFHIIPLYLSETGLGIFRCLSSNIQLRFKLNSERKRHNHCQETKKKSFKIIKRSYVKEDSFQLIQTKALFPLFLNRVPVWRNHRILERRIRNLCRIPQQRRDLLQTYPDPSLYCMKKKCGDLNQ